MSTASKKAKTNFSLWLEKEMATLQIDSASLASMSRLEYSYVRKLLTDRKPSLQAAKKIGNAIGKPKEALIAAGLIDKEIGDSTEKIPQKELFPFFVYLNWLERLGIYNSEQIELLSEVIQQLFNWYLENFRIKKAQISDFIKKSNAQLSLLSMAPAKYKDYGILTTKMVDFVLQQKPPSIYSKKYKDIQNNPLFRIPFIKTKIFNKLEYEEGLELLCPFVFLPLRILRPIYDPGINLATLGNLSDEERSEIIDYFTDKHSLYMSVSQNERDALLQLAKYISEYLWDVLGIGFESLRNSDDFYDSKVLYQKNRNVYVFATTSGLMVPEEYYGSLLSRKLRTKNKGVAEKNPLRLSYFNDGILHGIRNGCRVHYQFDIKRTSAAFKQGYMYADEKNKYLEAASTILFEYFNEPEIEISQSVFEEEGSILKNDWRNWLTLVSEKYVVLSARQPETKKMVHGLILDSNLFNAMLPSNVDSDNVFDIAKDLFEKGNHGFIKELMKTKSLEEARDFINKLL
jgi:hypothetical protein